MSITRDDLGIISQIQPDGSFDGGDSLCWMGHWMYLNDGVDPETGWTTLEFIQFFEVKPGAYVRHPVPRLSYNGFAAYYNGPYDGVVSRDQYHGVLAALIAGKERAALARAFAHHGHWLWLFMYNTRINGPAPGTTPWKWPDLTLFDIWAMYIRGSGWLGYLLYPLLLVCDLQLFLASVVIEEEPVEKDDVINHCIKLIIAKEHLPTPLSWLARLVLSPEKIKSKLEMYWGGWRQQPGFIPLYLKRLFG